MFKSRQLLLLLSTFTLILGITAALELSPAPAQGDRTAMEPSEWNGDFAEGWRQYDALVKDQKYEAASSLVETMLERAREAKNSAEWTRALIRYTQLRMALHGYETTVRFLKEQAWPEDEMNAAVVNLFYAHVLTTYAQNYSWEINQRERTEAKGAVDLKAWTRDQIYEEAQRAFENVWQIRARLGEMPVTEWKEFLIPNTYPEGVRPTLRDAVSYLRVEMLADTNGWRPEQLNDIYRLNLESLAGGVREDLSLIDPARHPLEKISFILADLENWHMEKERRAAALEARLERYRRLHQHFTRVEDRKFIQNDLERALKSFAETPWWSEGMAQLAEFARMDDEPDALVRARQIALQGEKAFSGSPGAQHCRTIREQIEAPDYALSGMQNDNPAKKSLLVTHKNLAKVFFRAWPINLQETIAASDDFNLLPAGREVERIMAGAPAESWEAALPSTPDYRMHKTYVVPPIKRPGAWLIAASDRADFPRKENKLQALYITLGDLVLVTQRPSGLLQPARGSRANQAEVRVLSGSTGRPLPGVEVLLYRYDWQTRHRQSESKTTDARGIVNFSFEQGRYNYFLLARRGAEVSLDDRPLYSQQAPPSGRSRATLLFTDRSIYRPAQKVLWKAVAYESEYAEGRFSTAPRRNLTISLKDANNQTVESQTVATNDFGTASGEFVIPPGRALGGWHLESSANGRVMVRVEEYKRPTFETEILDPEQALRLNRPATIKGEAKYYFGLPVSNGQAKWVVKREPVFPWWWWLRRPGAQGPQASQVIAAGSTPIEADGTFAFTFTPEADERLGEEKEISYRYSVSADVTDEGGETRSAQRTFRVGFVSVQATAEMEKNFFLEHDPIAIRIRRSSLDGVPRAGKGSWRVAALKTPARALLPAEQPLPPAEGFQTPGDRERERWMHRYNPEAVLLQWEAGETRASGSLSHDDKGEAKIEIASLRPGAYRLIYETVDEFGAQCEMKKDFVVGTASLALPLPALLMPEKTSLQPGETARILAHSGLPDQPMTLELYRAGALVRRMQLNSGADSALVEVPVTEQDRGGLMISLSLLRDNQFIQISSQVMVPWDNKKLKVEFSSFRDRLRPGSRETWSVRVTAPEGADAAVPAAELLAYMYDRSLDAFVPHAPARPIDLYPLRAYGQPPSANLREAPIQWVASDGFGQAAGWRGFGRDHLQFYGGYGIGGLGIRARLSGAVPLRLESAMVAEAPAPMAMDAVNVSEAREMKVQLESSVTPEQGPQPDIELRADFSETAFWHPHLRTDADGSVAFDFEVPDSVTSWNVWVHAITRDFQSGSVTREARSVKELMVRPYLPRFLREGDEAEIKVVVNNAGEKELTGKLDFDIIDAATEESLLPQFGLSKAEASGKAFTVPAGGGTNLTIPIKTPARVGQIAFKVTAVSGAFSDGELRPVPILPGRMHLMQSRFITMKEPGRRVMRFEDLARGGDPTRINEQLVVTLDAQLFYSVLSALPYLVNYPYECTEQTLNRFVSTGILSSLYGQYPAIERMAKEFSARETHFEQWAAPDPNRRMALEETPWLQMAQGGQESSSDLINVLDARIARAQRETSLAQLRKAQTSSGGFPWFPGGPPSPYMTLYILYGFSKALEFGVDVPRELARPAWDYLHRHYLDDIVRDMVEHDSGWEFVTFINYVLSNYPDESWYEGTFTAAERKTMLDFSFKHWRKHSPYLKGYLSLTLKRMGRPKDALLVWESVMDSAKTAEDQGTFWAPEERGWLWYNDRIETHAFAIRTEMELIPDDPKLEGLVTWIFLNKKLNHWNSTRATAEVIYSLAHYLQKTGQLGIREDATVTVANQKTGFVFEPDSYTGRKNQVVIPGDRIDPETSAAISVEKSGKGHLFASATWHFSTEQLPEDERGDYLRVSRRYFKRVNTGTEFTLQPLAEGAVLEPGDEVEVQLSLSSKHPMEYVHLRDPRAAGFEPSSALSRHKWDLGISWYEEIRDSGTNFFFEHLPQGEYTFKYRIRAAAAGVFKVAPATLQPMYAPEFAAYSSGATLRIK